MPEFSLPEVESLDEVPEEYRGFYFEKDGKVHRQDPAAMASTMAKTRRENEALKKDKETLQGQIGGYQEVLGDDELSPEYLKTLKEKAALGEKAPTDTEVEKRISTIEANHGKKIEALNKTIGDKDAIIEKIAVRGALVDALKQAKANGDGIELLPDRMRKRVEIAYTADGDIKLSPLDEDGTRMYAEDGSDATLLDLANQLKAKHGNLFEGTTATGMNTSGETVTVPKDAKNWWKMTDQERIEFTKKHGKDKATALMGQSPMESETAA